MQNEKILLKKYLDEAFYYLSEKERKNMLNKLCSFGKNSTFYVQYFNDNLSKIGVKYCINGIKCIFYYSTKYDSEILNL